MKILVTGSAGFIGSHLCERLLDDEKNHVIGIDNFDPFYNRTIKRLNVGILKKYRNFEFFDTDLNDMATGLLPDRLDVAIHLAAKAGVRPSFKSPTDYIDTNIGGTVSLMEFLRKKGIKKFIFTSSSSIYGNCRETPFKEDSPPGRPISVYAASKQAGEIFTKMYHDLYGMDVINLRLFTVYGPRQRPDLAIHRFLKAAHLGEEMTLFGDGSMARDYTYVGDIALGIVASLERVLQHDGLCETYNLGNSSPVSLNTLISIIEEVTGKKGNIVRKAVPMGDVSITYADISLAKEKLGYSPKTTLREGIGKMYSWIREIYS